jgi:hypothetical protein
MLLYCWTIAPGSTSHAAAASGVTADLETAMRNADSHLLAGNGILGLVEAVRTAMTTHSLDPCYERVGVAWLGRRTRTGTVRWSKISVPTPGSKLS